MEGPEPSKRGAGDKLWRTTEARGRGVAGWAGRGDEERGFATLALAAGALYFVSLLLPWIHSLLAWTLAALRLGTVRGSAQ
jgi:hypothetical protein